MDLPCDCSPIIHLNISVTSLRLSVTVDSQLHYHLDSRNVNTLHVRGRLPFQEPALFSYLLQRYSVEHTRMLRSSKHFLRVNQGSMQVLARLALK